MAYILYGSKTRLKTIPFNKIDGVFLSKPEETGEETGEEAEVKTATIGLNVSDKPDAITLRSVSGEGKVIEAVEEDYRKILKGLADGKPVNLTDFTVTPKSNTQTKPKSASTKANSAA